VWRSVVFSLSAFFLERVVHGVGFFLLAFFLDVWCMALALFFIFNYQTNKDMLTIVQTLRNIKLQNSITI
jgi:hypothetical protein